MPRPNAAMLLLVGLVAADVVLVTGAIRSTHVDTAQMARAMDSATAPTSAAPSPKGSAATATAQSETKSGSGKVIVAALSDKRAWRAVSSSVICSPDSEAADIGRSQNGGKDWTTVKVPLNTVSGLSYAGGRVIATGMDASCQPAAYALSSSDAPSVTTKEPTWVIDPADPTKLMSSGGSVAKQPCSSGLLDIAANSKSDVVALCGDHSIEHSTTAGDSWQQERGGSKVLAIATGTNTIFTASRAKCGISVAAVPGGDNTNCVAGTKDWSGPVDMTIVGGTVWLATADDAVTEPVADFT
ncbi:hypothetical protein GCM10011492_22480 [Flexivirga endophytica]|uniref:Uncharacterized protein n=1 Tax=Flexivirga endophytica TaxID=1849103 RepID=A0A916T5P8_9MICO|nr:hypothetical protein [Flexivirga endophytica]GGB31348.1 hypothetical protein GCM10011492_22480 [Flexivirga endophytica]GHB52301.1 hypothetical protein GCM10008112_21750 [Flexivirga endophytica]